MASSFRTSPSGPLVACTVVYALALGVAVLVWHGLRDSHPINVALVADVAATLVIFAAGTLLRNSSLYDPYWTVAPPLLALYYMMQPGAIAADQLRGGLVFLLVMFWAGRLTFNCFRRWENLEHEDFRYINLRKNSGRLYPLTDLFGIQLLPTLLVFLGCLPFYPIFAMVTRPFNGIDLLAAIVMLSAVIVEAVADEQLTEFKRTNRQSGKVCKHGLWAWARHPNYLGEIGFWWGLWLFALGCGTEWWWTGIGAAAITALFVFISIPMIEKRKRISRPDYDKQVAGIPRLLLRRPTKH